MESDMATRALMQQRLESLEVDLYNAVSRIENTSAEVNTKERVVEELKAEVVKLSAALSRTEAEKRQLAVEKERNDERTTAAFRQSTTDAQVALQLRNLTEKLDDVMSSRHTITAENAELQKEVEKNKHELRSTKEALSEMESALKDSQDSEAAWRKRHDDVHDQMQTIRQELDRKMDDWFQRERKATMRMTDVSKERDELKLALQRKLEEYEETSETLRNTSAAFGECLSTLNMTLKRKEGNGASQAGPSRKIARLARSLPDVQLTQQSTSSSDLEPEVDLWTFSPEQLRLKHADLVARFNQEVQENIANVARAEDVLRQHSQAGAENAALSLELEQMSQTAEDRTAKIQQMTDRIKSLTQEVDELRAVRYDNDSQLQALEKTNDDYTAQLRFLLKKNQERGKRMVHTESKKVHGVTLRHSFDPRSPPVSINEVVDMNRELKIENHKLKLDMEELKKKTSEDREVVVPTSELEDVDAVDDDLAMTTAPSPSASADQDGVNRKKKRARVQAPDKIREDDAELREWITKCDDAQTALVNARAAHTEELTELTQTLEKTQTQNELYVHDMQSLEHQLVECQMANNAMTEKYKTMEAAYKSQMEVCTEQLKNMESVIYQMRDETTTLKNQLAEAKAAHDIDAAKLREERSMFNRLQAISIEAEREHMEEMKAKKAQLQQQSAELCRLRAQDAVSELEKKKLDHAGSSMETARSVRQQLVEKDQVILELERRLQASNEAISKDLVYEIQSKLSEAEAQLAAEKENLKRLQDTFNASLQQHSEQLQLNREAYEQSSKDLHERLANVEAERDATNLEILKWKSQCDKYQKQDEDLMNEIVSIKDDHAHVIADLQMKLDAAQQQIQELTSQIESKEKLLMSRTQQVHDLTRTVRSKAEELKLSKKQSLDAEEKLAECMKGQQTASEELKKNTSSPVKTPTVGDHNIPEVEEETKQKATSLEVPVVSSNVEEKSEEPLLPVQDGGLSSLLLRAKMAVAPSPQPALNSTQQGTQKDAVSTLAGHLVPGVDNAACGIEHAAATVEETPSLVTQPPGNPEPDGKVTDSGGADVIPTVDAEQVERAQGVDGIKTEEETADTNTPNEEEAPFRPSETHQDLPAGTPELGIKRKAEDGSESSEAQPGRATTSTGTEEHKQQESARPKWEKIVYTNVPKRKKDPSEDKKKFRGPKH